MAKKWILQVASEGEEAGKVGRMRWNHIRKLQVIHAKRRPTRPSILPDC